MKSIWSLIILTLFVQEAASTDVAIFQVRHLHFNLWIINLMWVIATSIDILVGYWIGKKIQEKFKGSKFETFGRKWSAKTEDLIGKKGQRFALLVLGIINFPYANAFISSWLSIPFKNVFILLFIGDALYWGIEWGVNIGVRGFAGPHTALYIVIGLGLLISIFSKIIFNKILKSNEN